MPAFACIFVPDFPLEALLRAEPELRSQSLAVLEGKAPLQKVFAVNENARRAGVSPGMSKLQREACTSLVLRARSLSQEAAAHATLLDCAQSFSPRGEAAGCDTIVLDLAGLEPLFGPLPKIARALARRASDLGLETSVAVAGNPDTAALAARGFSGVTVIPEGKEAEMLGSLPVEVLFGNSAQESGQLLETFSRWGIRKLRDLAALPDIALSERLGQAGIHLQTLARGATSRTLVPFEPQLIFEEVIELENQLFLLEPLTFLKLLQIDLKAHPPGAPIVKIHLAAEPVRPRAAQNGLFLSPAPEPEKLELTLARIAGIVGEDKVGSLELLDTHRPEGFRMQRFAPSEPFSPRRHPSTVLRAGSATEKNNPHFSVQMSSMNSSVPELALSERCLGGGFGTDSSDDLVTALRIFRPPVGVVVTMEDGNPAYISCPKNKEMQGEILGAAGPWRSSGDWWEQEGWARDEWDIAVQGETGIALYRLVRDRLGGRWFLEGSYD